MLRRTQTAFCSLVLMALLGACAMIDTVDPRYDSVNRSTAKARNESILLNIVRASHSVPLNFVAFTRVSGSTSVGANAGLPTFGLGQFFPPGLNILPSPPSPREFALSNSTLGGTTHAGNNFDIGVLETQDFYNGLLKPVDLPTVNFFIRQGYSRELLFWLFAESVRETALGQTIEFLNDPNPGLSCQTTRGIERCFSDMVDVAIASGLTIETRRIKERIVARFCFDHVLADRAMKEYGPEIGRFLLSNVHRPRCKIDPWPTNRLETDTLEFTFAGTPYGTVYYEIIPRSGFGIYQFLGRILASGQQGTLRLRGTHYPPAEDRRILAVERAGAGGCLVDVSFEDEYYCVPLHGAQNTKRIMGLLAQLIAINTNTKDLAITPTVRAVQ